MAKKNKNISKGGDNRGYSTTTTASAAIKKNGNTTSTTKSTKNDGMSGISTTNANSNISPTFKPSIHQGLEALQEYLLNRFDDLHNNNNTLTSSSPSEKLNTEEETLFLDPENVDEKLYKRIGILLDHLLELKFTLEQITKAISATFGDDKGLVNEDTILDWLCLHIPSNELPILFTDRDTRDIENFDMVTTKSIPTVIVPVANTITTWQDDDDFVNVSSQQQQQQSDIFSYEESKDDPSFIISEEENSNIKNVISSDQKSWILSQYEFLNDNDNDDMKTKVDNIPINDVSSSKSHVDDAVDDVTNELNSIIIDDGIVPLSSHVEVTTPINIVHIKSADEIRLDNLRIELKDMEEDVNDPVNNYMRSKHEVKALQKKIQLLRQQVKGMERKVEKILATTKIEKLSATATENNTTEIGFDNNESINALSKHAEVVVVAEDDDDIESSDEMNIFNIFNEDSAAISLTDKTNKEKMNDINNNQTNDDDHEITMTINIPEDSIPKSWTGKTPKILLEEYCKKEKILRNHITFQKLICNGCQLKIIINKKKIHEFEIIGPISTYSNAQNYVATIALYQFNPDRPLYRLLPPYYRDLWKSWIDHKNNEQNVIRQTIEDDRKTIIKDIIKQIPIIKKQKGFDKSTPHNKSYNNVIDHDNNRDDDDDQNQNHMKRDIQKPSTTNNKNDKIMKVINFPKSQSKYNEMFQFRQTLPIFSCREELLTAINVDNVTIISAETGSGKTTQCASYILEEAIYDKNEHYVSIICTQPRRVAAVSVAERVAEELAEDTTGNLIGYQVRLESKKSNQTKILFCTTGIVLKRLIEDPMLHGISHVVVDECHERQWQIDCLLIFLRQLIRTSRPDLKVILMSATLDTMLFRSFFGNATIIHVPGRTFPVNTYYLEDLLQITGHRIEEDSICARRNISDRASVSLWVTTRNGEKRKETAEYEKNDGVSDKYPTYSLDTRRSMDRVDETILNYDLIEDVLHNILLQSSSKFISPDGQIYAKGAVLIFLQGIREIRGLYDRLIGSREFGNIKRFDIIPLHSKLSSSDQRRAFKPSSNGCRKIIISTNIAETSVTIPDVFYVIDSGRVREIQRDKRSGSQCLVSMWCSRASAKQRAGRAGRVQPGVCLKLYSTETEQVVMQNESEPELRRIPLEEVCLTILASGYTRSCTGFLSQAPQPPTDESIRSALQILSDIGAVSMQTLPSSSIHLPQQLEVLTPLGLHLAKLPVDARIGKMLIFGTIFKCLDSILTISAWLSASKTPFASYFANNQIAKSCHASFAHPSSDYCTMLNLWEKFIDAKNNGRADKFCNVMYLNYASLMEIYDARLHYTDLLCSIGFLNKTILYDHKKRLYDIRLIEKSVYSINRKKEEVVHAVVCGGLYPNVAYVSKQSNGQYIVVQKTMQLYVNDSVNTKLPISIPSPWLVYFEKFGTDRRMTISNTAFVSPFCLMLFGINIKVLHTQRQVVIDDWIQLHVSAKTGIVFCQVRNLFNDLLQNKFDESTTHHHTLNSNNSSSSILSDGVDHIVQLLCT